MRVRVFGNRQGVKGEQSQSGQVKGEHDRLLADGVQKEDLPDIHTKTNLQVFIPASPDFRSFPQPCRRKLRKSGPHCSNLENTPGFDREIARKTK